MEKEEGEAERCQQHRGDEEALHAACRQEEAKASRDRREAYADAFA